MKNLIVHLQSNSPELVAGDAKEFPGAFAGDWLLPRDNGRILAKGATGYEFLVVAGDRVYVEYKPARGGWVKNHLEKPSNASWFERDDSPDGKEGLYLVDIDGNPGNRIEETIYARVLVLPDDGGAPFVVTQAYKSTAKSIGATCSAARPARSTARTSNPVTIKWRMTSRLERSGDQRWYAPIRTCLGDFGEPNGSDRRGGPSWRSIAQGAQDRRKLGSAARAADAAQSVSPDRTPAVRASARRHRGIDRHHQRASGAEERRNRAASRT